MLFVLIRIEFGAVSNLVITETLLALPGFSVPHFDVSIVGTAQESITNVVEIRVTNGLPAKKKVLVHQEKRLEKKRVIAYLCPEYVRMHRLFLYTSQSLTFVSMDPDKSK